MIQCPLPHGRPRRGSCFAFTSRSSHWSRSPDGPTSSSARPTSSRPSRSPVPRPPTATDLDSVWTATTHSTARGHSAGAQRRGAPSCGRARHDTTGNDGTPPWGRSVRRSTTRSYGRPRSSCQIRVHLFGVSSGCDYHGRLRFSSIRRLRGANRRNAHVASTRRALYSPRSNACRNRRWDAGSHSVIIGSISCDAGFR